MFFFSYFNNNPSADTHIDFNFSFFHSNIASTDLNLTSLHRSRNANNVNKSQTDFLFFLSSFPIQKDILRFVTVLWLWDLFFLSNNFFLFFLYFIFVLCCPLQNYCIFICQLLLLLLKLFFISLVHSLAHSRFKSVERAQVT